MNEFIDVYLGNDSDRKARAIAAEKALRATMLAETAKKPIRRVFQFDHFCQGHHDDLFGGWNWEFRRCDIPVRAQVLAGTDRTVAIEALRAMADWIEKNPDLMKVEPIEPAKLPADPSQKTFDF